RPHRSNVARLSLLRAGPVCVDSGRVFKMAACVRTSSFDTFDDPRRAVHEFKRKVSAEDLRAPLPGSGSSPSGAASRRARSDPDPDRTRSQQGAVLLGRLWSTKLMQAVAQICGPDLALKGQVKAASASSAPPPRRWYRVHPITNTLYFVRPDAGLRGRIPGYSSRSDSKDAIIERGSTQPELSSSSALPMRSTRHLQRRPSLPAEVERGLGLTPECLDSLLDCTCKICYEQPSD
ncbi:unnamed protein product, partial [Polarella glacialis]